MFVQPASFLPAEPSLQAPSSHSESEEAQFRDVEDFHRVHGQQGEHKFTQVVCYASVSQCVCVSVCVHMCVFLHHSIL